MRYHHVWEQLLCLQLRYHEPWCCLWLLWWLWWVSCLVRRWHFKRSMHGIRWMQFHCRRHHHQKLFIRGMHRDWVPSTSKYYYRHSWHHLKHLCPLSYQRIVGKESFRTLLNMCKACEQVLGDCEGDNTTDAAICPCAQKFIVCVEDLNCATESDLATVQQNCLDAGCNAAQCAVSASLFLWSTMKLCMCR